MDRRNLLSRAALLGGTQVSGWVDACQAAARAYVVAARNASDIAAASISPGATTCDWWSKGAAMAIRAPRQAFRFFLHGVRRRAGCFHWGSAEHCRGARPAVSRIRKTSARAVGR